MLQFENPGTLVLNFFPNNKERKVHVVQLSTISCLSCLSKDFFAAKNSDKRIRQSLGPTINFFLVLISHRLEIALWENNNDDSKKRTIKIKNEQKNNTKNTYAKKRSSGKEILTFLSLLYKQYSTKNGKQEVYNFTLHCRIQTLR